MGALPVRASRRERSIDGSTPSAATSIWYITGRPLTTVTAWSATARARPRPVRCEPRVKTTVAPRSRLGSVSTSMPWPCQSGSAHSTTSEGPRPPLPAQESTRSRTAAWLITIPLGSPVEPEVQCTTKSVGRYAWGGLAAGAVARPRTVGSARTEPMPPGPSRSTASRSNLAARRAVSSGVALPSSSTMTDRTLAAAK